MPLSLRDVAQLGKLAHSQCEQLDSAPSQCNLPAAMGGSGFGLSLGGISKRSGTAPKLAFGLGTAKPKLAAAFAEDSDSDGEAAAEAASKQRTGCTACREPSCSHVCTCCSRPFSAALAAGLPIPRLCLTPPMRCCCFRGHACCCCCATAAAAAARRFRGAEGGGQAGRICGKERPLLRVHHKGAQPGRHSFQVSNNIGCAVTLCDCRVCCTHSLYAVLARILSVCRLMRSAHMLPCPTLLQVPVRPQLRRVSVLRC